VAFTSLLGSSKAATDQIQALQKFAASTPFSQEDVFGYAQQYFALADSVGLAKDQVQPFLSAIGDVASVTGASTEAIRNSVMAIGQIGSSGKVTLENLNQISEAFPGFNAAAAIGAATGQKTADVLDQISKGTLDAKTGVQALILGMQKFPGAAGAMEKQAADPQRPVLHLQGHHQHHRDAGVPAAGPDREEHPRQSSLRSSGPCCRAWRR
jgi:tape measure domain-containing protein